MGNLTHKQVRDLSYQYHYNDGNQLVQADHWRLRHSGAGNSRGNGPAYDVHGCTNVAGAGCAGATNSNGILSNWDIHHLDQQHLFEFMWDPSVNHNQDKLTQTYAYNQNGQLTQKNLGNGASETYQHDALGRMTAQTTEYGAQYQFAYDAQDRRVHTQLSDWERSYQYGSLYDGRQELAQWDNQGNPYRTLNYLPGEQGLPYGTLISQNVHQWQNDEFRVTGFAQNYAETGYFHQDHLGSTVKITGPEAGNAFRWDYTPQGEAYGFTHRYSHEQMTRTHVGHSPKRHLVPYLYTGQYETNLTGLIHMDARWYNPQLGRWLQPDYYSFNQLALPQSARHQLLGSTKLNTQQLLRDPSQQMAYGYVSGNPLRWVDPNGLVAFVANAVGAGVGFLLDASIQALEIHVLETREEFNIKQSLVAAGAGAVGGGIGTSAARLAGAVGTSINVGRTTQAAIATTTFYGANAGLNSSLAVGTGYISAQVDDREYSMENMLLDAGAGAILGTAANRLHPANSNLIDNFGAVNSLGIVERLDQPWYSPALPSDGITSGLIGASIASNLTSTMGLLLNPNNSGPCP
ncbi:RHS repeat domain-containing protein [Salinispirillum marinum]|uniref:RHS repeat domain-containing protein n=2 Tax=Saccharospirillaceae TaxID=255527 RepID=A0ABV8BI79_9GAMM